MPSSKSLKIVTGGGIVRTKLIFKDVTEENDGLLESMLELFFACYHFLFDDMKEVTVIAERHDNTICISPAPGHKILECARNSDNGGGILARVKDGWCMIQIGTGHFRFQIFLNPIGR